MQPIIANLLERAAQQVSANPHLRYGQAVFNLINEEFPKFADVLRGTDKDPFYVDARIPAMLEWLEMYLCPEEQTLRSGLENILERYASLEFSHPHVSGWMDEIRKLLK